MKHFLTKDRVDFSPKMFCNLNNLASDLIFVQPLCFDCQVCIELLSTIVSIKLVWHLLIKTMFENQLHLVGPEQAVYLVHLLELTVFFVRNNLGFQLTVNKPVKSFRHRLPKKRDWLFSALVRRMTDITVACY